MAKEILRIKIEASPEVIMATILGNDSVKHLIRALDFMNNEIKRYESLGYTISEEDSNTLTFTATKIS